MDLSTFIQLIVGGLLAIFGGAATAWAGLRQARIQAKAAADLDSAKRRDDRLLAREAFQRENLLELQIAFNEWLRAMALVFMHDRKSVAHSGTIEPLSDELNDSWLEAARRFARLTECVLDDHLRETLQSFNLSSAAYLTASRANQSGYSGADVDALMAEFTVTGSKLQPQIGEALRAYLRGRD